MNNKGNTLQIFPLTTTLRQAFDAWAPALLCLGLRLWLAQVFFKSGLTKIASWDSTLALFAYEYQVPLLSPEVAAYLGTAVELIVPVTLAFGLLTRFSALILFVFNAIAVISYPDLSEVGVKDHVYWGMLLAVPFVMGGGSGGRLTLDAVWHSWRKERKAHVA